MGTFGRGIYVLDDYSPLRTQDKALAKPAHLFDMKKAWLYVEGDRFGGGSKGNRGVSLWQTPNPPFGAVFTYHLQETLVSRKAARLKRESVRRNARQDNPYPSWEQLKEEGREEAPQLFLTIYDADGRVVRRLSGPTKAGLHRVAWDLRYPATDPIDLSSKGFRPPWWQAPRGPMVLPGVYSVTLSQRVDGETRVLAGPQRFEVAALDQKSPLVTSNRKALLSFQQRVAELYRAVTGAAKSLQEMEQRIAHLKKAIERTPGVGDGLLHRLRKIETQLQDLKVVLSGDQTRQKYNEPSPWSIERRVGRIVYGSWSTQTAPTGTHQQVYKDAAGQFDQVLTALKKNDRYLDAVEDEVEAAMGPWTPGRLPEWKKEATGSP
ncbi:MAG: hypothetical protein AAF449_07610 [Myxococcota bacterium]